MIEIKNLDIGYKQHQPVFKNISFCLNQGELVGLIGDNGIGKSTLLKTLTGALAPLAGCVHINQQLIQNYTPHELSQLLSIVVTDKVAGFNLTVWDVVAAGRTPYINIFGKLLNEDCDIVEQSLEQLQIRHLKDKLIDELSDGQRQKAMIAKSLAQQTNIIILDEPTAYLDYKSKHQLFVVLKKLCEEQNKLIITSSHDLDIMNQYSHKSVIMESDNRLGVV